MKNYFECIINWIYNDQEKPNWRRILFVLLVIYFFINLGFNLSQGYLFFPPFRLESPVAFVRFQSSVTPFSIKHPRDWRASDLKSGNHGDREIISMIQHRDLTAPGITVVHKRISQGTIEDVIQWGTDRFVSKQNSVRWKQLSLEERLIDEKLAFWQTFKTTNMTCYQIYLLNQENAYAVSLCARLKDWSPELEDLFQQMIESIQF